MVEREVLARQVVGFAHEDSGVLLGSSSPLQRVACDGGNRGRGQPAGRADLRTDTPRASQGGSLLALEVSLLGDRLDHHDGPVGEARSLAAWMDSAIATSTGFVARRRLDRAMLCAVVRAADADAMPPYVGYP